MSCAESKRCDCEISERDGAGGDGRLAHRSHSDVGSIRGGSWILRRNQAGNDKLPNHHVITSRLKWSAVQESIHKGVTGVGWVERGPVTEVLSTRGAYWRARLGGRRGIPLCTGFVFWAAGGGPLSISPLLSMKAGRGPTPLGAHWEPHGSHDGLRPSVTSCAADRHCEVFIQSGFKRSSETNPGVIDLSGVGVRRDPLPDGRGSVEGGVLRPVVWHTSTLACRTLTLPGGTMDFACKLLISLGERKMNFPVNQFLGLARRETMREVRTRRPSVGKVRRMPGPT